MGKDDDEPESDDDFGFYFPQWYVIDTWLEHREHGTYPEPGGYNDQDAQLMVDWRTLNARYNRQVRLIADDQSDQTDISTSKTAKDWTDFD